MATISVAKESPADMDRKTSWVMPHGFGNLERTMARWFFVETFIRADFPMVDLQSRLLRHFFYAPDLELGMFIIGDRWVTGDFVGSNQ